MKVLLIDGHSILNRAFYGLPDLTNSAGVHTGAVYGFITIMQRFIAEEQPDILTVAFDLHAPTFRHKMFEAYKGTRHAMPEELKSQVPMIQELLRAMGITVVTKEGIEADDILGTLAKKCQSLGYEVTVLSGDRDLLQLADEHIKIAIPKTSKGQTTVENYYAADVLEKKGVSPLEFIDVKALMGDTSDNIPGVSGIGEKTATAIIQQYHSIENAFEHVDELKPPRASVNLKAEYETAVMSKTLATIITDAEIDWDSDSAKLGDIYTPDAFTLCKEWEFKNLLSKFSGEAKSESASIEFDKVSDEKKITAAFSDIMELVGSGEVSDIGLSIIGTDSSLLVIGVSLMDKTYVFDAHEPSVRSSLLQGLDRLLSTVNESDIRLCMSGIKDTLHFLMRAYGDDREWLRSEEDKVPVWAMNEKTGQPEGDPLALMLNDGISSVLESGPGGAFDMSIAAYLHNPLLGSYDHDIVAREFLGQSVPAYEELLGKKKAIEAADLENEGVWKLAAYRASIPLLCVDPLLKKLEEEKMLSLYNEIEYPLVLCLYRMELEGIAIDAQALRDYGDSLVSEIDRLEKEIFKAAGEEFNINSPKQLGVILFEKMGLPGGKKTKTGYSTAADVLEKLAPEQPVIRDILSYRQLTKLKSTYADGLAGCIALDGRIHTRFQQTVTATGRLSSTDPNLQNIPIRIELGRLIRKVFLPREGCVFADADYSQIELRVLAALSGDERLIQAYREDQDIHRATAALVFHKDPSEVTDLDRRNAKAVNFGIVYGISSFGLGEDLGIGRKEAQKYIDDYFVAYPGLKQYIDELVAFAKEKGYALTKYDRRRPIPELASSNFMQRSFGERVAMNAPIQGTAADIIKIAMLRVDRRLRAEALKSKLILQVHDELLIETYEDEIEKVEAILKEEMKAAADLAVPLEVGYAQGNTWYDAK